MGNPFHSYAGIFERSTRRVHLYTRNTPGVVGYQLWVGPNINDAYGNPVGSGVAGAGPSALFTVSRDECFRSPTVRRKGFVVPESQRGTTHMVFDPDDYTVAGAGTALPMEESWIVLRLQENHSSVGLLNLAGNPAIPALGPLYLVPPATAYMQPGATFSMEGIAPSATGCAAGLPPSYNQDMMVATPRPLHLVFPRPVRELTLRNLGGGNDILVSLGSTQTMMTIKQGVDFQLYTGTTKEMVLACSGAGGCAFRLHAVLSPE